MKTYLLKGPALALAKEYDKTIDQANAQIRTLMEQRDAILAGTNVKLKQYIDEIKKGLGLAPEAAIELDTSYLAPHEMAVLKVIEDATMIHVEETRTLQ